MSNNKKNLTCQQRNALGCLGWFLLATLLSAAVWPVMVGREVWQWKHYRLPRFEWDDIVRYTLAIWLGALCNWELIILLGIVNN